MENLKINSKSLHLFSTFKLILASSSPRRKSLIEKSGISVSIRKPRSSENWVKSDSILENLKRISYEKASSVTFASRTEMNLILAADTVVVSPDNKIFGKPKSNQDARNMLQCLSGRDHYVWTGYCLIGHNKNLSKIIYNVTCSKVRFRTIESDEITWYLNTKESDDKAGAYAIQGYGAGFVKKIVGSYSNIVGLPMAEFILDLNRVLKRLNRKN